MSKKEIEKSKSAKINNDNDIFSLEALKIHFENCLSSEGLINIEHYIRGYEELDKFLHLLGTVFGWVASDLQSKLEILRERRRNSEVCRNYNDLRSMVNYELKEKAIKFTARDDPSGSRNLLRLHRALEFIVLFMESLNKLENQDKCVSSAQEAYKVTLEKYHPWIVQKASLLAMHMLPTREGLLVKVCGDNLENQEKAIENFNHAIKAMKVVYDETDKIYKENGLTDLP